MTTGTRRTVRNGAPRNDLVLDTYRESDMTTETQTDIARSVGRLEGQAEQTNERLGRIEQRLDRLIFTLFGFEAAILVGLAVIMVRLFLSGG